MKRLAFACMHVFAVLIAAYAILAYGFRPLGEFVGPEMRANFQAHQLGIYTHVFAATIALLLVPIGFGAVLLADAALALNVALLLTLAGGDATPHAGKRTPIFSIPVEPVASSPTGTPGGKIAFGVAKVHVIAFPTFVTLSTLPPTGE